MKVASDMMRKQVAGLRARIRKDGSVWQNDGDERPLRSELFSADQMEQHGKTLAGLHELSLESASDRLLARLAENEVFLFGVRTLVAEAAKAGRRITPAAEWLLDNFYLIEEQIRTVKRHLPKGYSRQLPRLASGPSAGLPRVYDLALETVAHSDARVDLEILTRFVEAYQTVAVLKLGELWALPIMLRLALIENLRRVGLLIAADRFDSSRADHWADRMRETAETDPKSLILVTADMARSNPPMVGSFVAELARRLQGQGPALALPLTWIEQRLAESGWTIKQLVQSESQQQAADQVSVSNSIRSLRFLGAMDWQEFVEMTSVVERTLRGDIGGVYGRMDFATRDSYRHSVEALAKRGRLSESEVARAAIQLAHESAGRKGAHERETHVGFYLVGEGLPQLERMVGFYRKPLEVLHYAMTRRFALTTYLGTITLLSFLVSAGLLASAHEGGLRGWPLAALGALAFLGASHFAAALANWLATLFAMPRALPRMDFSEGIPPEFLTLVVVPTILTSSQYIKEQIEGLEVRFLANQDDNLYFGLLTDFVDAGEETLAEDESLVRQLQRQIEDLNARYGSAKRDPFFLFHRPRRWNAQERLWMGYERKRGKLAELNLLLRGEASGRFSLILGDVAILQSVRYVITLDADAQLPRDAARDFVGVMAHPLNRPWYDERQERVTKGYGILQPRVAVSLPGTNQSRYARMCGSDPGIDPYTRAVSDVYQDLFSEGSFTGKGIYDVDAFEQALKDRFPENSILSHDTLEGCYARSGLLSDVLLYEEQPPRYTEDVSRRRRWIRGDWQVLRWLLSRVPGSDGKLRRNPISILAQWKLFDNLRRSLVPAALTLLLLLAWTALPTPWLWTLSVLGIILIPALLVSVVDLVRKPDEVKLSHHITAVARSTKRRLGHSGFTIACLPYEAMFSVAAILRTLWRMWISKRGLLEWNPSHSLKRERRTDLIAFFRSMWTAPALVCGAVVSILILRPSALPLAGPLLALWSLSPVIAWWVSRPLERGEAQLSVDQTAFLRRLARKTWAFFETFAGAEDHWLPPDNYQEEPTPRIGHRTSPTNMGLGLLANLTAYDFGYISGEQLIARTSNALETMAALKRYQGHFFNWYDTRTLKPLHPEYVSTVDSGNLAGHLLTLRQGLLEMMDHQILGPRLFDGLSDTLGTLKEVLSGSSPAEFAPLESALASAVNERPATVAAIRACLEELIELAANVAGSGHAAHTPDATPPGDAAWWATAFTRQCQEALEELKFLGPSAVVPTLRQLADRDESHDGKNNDTPDENVDERSEASARARSRIQAIERLAQQAVDLSQFRYDFLFDKGRRLLAIGYNVSELRRDESFYDLLASEARFTTFVAIAQGEIRQESWFALGRLLTSVGGEPLLFSWSGSMFEYLMPLLVMPTYPNTLLDHTYKAVVNAQIEYGRKRNVPWGVSESGYNAVDVQSNYQYRAFGVPGLGLKRGLGEDLVIAPYASALALMVMPEEACANLEQLAAEGMSGRFGFYEAVDYTSSRLPRGQTSVIVRSFMAHHQGMSLVAIAYLLLNQPMQRRFESDPLFQATTLLLQERLPKALTSYTHTLEVSSSHQASAAPEAPFRVFKSPHSSVPEVQLLSNGRYNVMINSAGGGYSRWGEMAVTRWREDLTCDNWGAFCYLSDVKSGEFWSTSYQPTLQPAEKYEAILSEARAEFRCSKNGFDTHMEITVSPEDDIELRRLRITNRSRTRRTIDVTSYAEVVLATSAADAMHPAFGGLFVQTEIEPRHGAILCTRRPRSPDENIPWMFHLMAARGAKIGEVSYETDRMRFIGRGNTVADPAAVRSFAPLSGSGGSVLDPIVAIRCRITFEPEESATINIVTGVGANREACLGLVDKYQDRRLAGRVFDLAWVHSQVVLRQLNVTYADALLYGRLAGSVIYANAALRTELTAIIKNKRGQSGLWGYSISGDLPIVLLQITDPANMELVRQLVQAHAYWRLKGLAVDLVIWNEDPAGYRQLLQDQIMGLISAGTEMDGKDRPGAIFVRPADQISPDDRLLIQSVARVILNDSRGTLADQVNRRAPVETAVALFKPLRARAAAVPARLEATAGELLFFNGLGGFTPDGHEYVITTTRNHMTPTPWVNVLANPKFGSVISESGAACTWGENALEFRLTPWSNDPVSDSSGEAYYLRDEETGQYWSPMPFPCRSELPYLSRHGFGYSVFEYAESGIRTEVWVYVAVGVPVKFIVVKVKNESGRSRKLSATGYTEWVLGDLRQKSAMHVVTEVEPDSGAVFAQNTFNSEFANRVGFFNVADRNRTVTGNRTEFIGRNGTLRNPAAMTRLRLSGRVGPALDPCAAFQVAFDLVNGEEREIVFTLGIGEGFDDAANLVNRFRGSAAARQALEDVWQHWNHTLGAVNVDTPDPSLNVLANGWLVYQTLACRLWARSGYYQPGGAFGFRDQLQDAMALIHTTPQLLREHLLLCAGRQFREGDVQHWWHPPSGRGVRTHCSDDFLWLPLAVCRYVLSTGDTGVLEEKMHFLEGRPVNPEEDSYYDMPIRSWEAATLFDHCVRAILHGLRMGEHGLPLMGSGDWNDGMNAVGEGGKGESVWLGFFLYEALTQFAKLARLYGDAPFADRCDEEARQLKGNIEENGWDGGWYRRAYFDNGAPLGSAKNEECQIDSIAQSWSVLSGAGNPDRSQVAMEAVDRRLVRRDHGLIQLLDPPFDKTDLNPGYIKGYVPGVRENGGQYTHAAIWTTMAFASLGDTERAWELFALINPVNHAKTPAAAEVYKVEPYVVAADVYAVSPHIGRGGWTWYTGSAGWMYRLILESLLGLRIESNKLHVNPCIPRSWKSFKVHYRYRETVYHITVTPAREGSGRITTVDGIKQDAEGILLVDDRQTHMVEVVMEPILQGVPSR